MRSNLCLGLAALLSLSGNAFAGERYGFAGPGYGPVPGYAVGRGYGGYGFAGEAVGGSYIGAPFTQFPRPSAIVPPAWGYGTYGVPTATGIRQAPVGDPKIYVVRGAGPRAPRAESGASFDGYDGAIPGGPRVVSVTVPRR